jgi:peptidoglycan hydrolase-like protein with peptidoglycan-binding domain
VSKAPLTTSQARAAWSPACSTSRTTVRFFTGVQVTIDPRVVPAFAALDQVLQRHGYRPRPGVTGAYVCRRITGGTGYSLHAYGTAVDINWDTNPYTTGRLVTDMPKAMVAEITALRTNSGAPVWGWGGAYRTIKDAMHYEIVCTPADLATGIAGTAGPLTRTEKLYIWLKAGVLARKRPFLRVGSENDPALVDDIKAAQQLLGLPQTGTYGPATVAKVKAFQEFLKIPHRGPAGRLNRRTWQWLIYDAFTRGRR